MSAHERCRPPSRDRPRRRLLQSAFLGRRVALLIFDLRRAFQRFEQAFKRLGGLLLAIASTAIGLASSPVSGCASLPDDRARNRAIAHGNHERLARRQAGQLAVEFRRNGRGVEPVLLPREAELVFCSTAISWSMLCASWISAIAVGFVGTVYCTWSRFQICRSAKMPGWLAMNARPRGRTAAGSC